MNATSSNIIKPYYLFKESCFNNVDEKKKFQTLIVYGGKLKLEPLDNLGKILEEKNKAMESLDYLDKIDDDEEYAKSIEYIYKEINIMSSAFDSCALSNSFESESNFSELNK